MSISTTSVLLREKKSFFKKRFAAEMKVVVSKICLRSLSYQKQSNIYLSVLSAEEYVVNEVNKTV